MPDPLHVRLSRRERQIMDAVYRLGEAAAADVVKRLADPPAYNSVRVTLGILEKKGFLKHRRDGQRHIYYPTIPAHKAKRSAMGHLLRTFFASSPSSAILTLLDMSVSKLSKGQLDEIAAWIEQAREASDDQPVE